MMRLNLLQTRSMKRYLVYTTDDLRVPPIDPTRFYSSVPFKNPRWAARVEKVGLAVNNKLHNVISDKLSQMSGANRSRTRSPRSPGAAQHEAQRNDALQTRDRYELRIFGGPGFSSASLRVLRCARDTRLGWGMAPDEARYAALEALGAPGALPRACSAIAIIEVPPNSMLMPTRRPSAHVAVSGSPARMMTARIRSMMPLTSIQAQRPVSSFLCSSAYMIEATPSMTKNTISSRVSETAPLIGQPSSTMPAAIPSTAETSDHQNPGAWRAMKVVTKPTTPLIRNSQPIRIATAMVATTGTTIASMPSTTRTMPSMRNSSQCS